MNVKRELQEKLEHRISPNKVIVVVGARRVGKNYPESAFKGLSADNYYHWLVD